MNPRKVLYLATAAAIFNLFAAWYFMYGAIGSTSETPVIVLLIAILLTLFLAPILTVYGMKLNHKNHDRMSKMIMFSGLGLILMPFIGWAIMAMALSGLK